MINAEKYFNLDTLPESSGIDASVLEELPGYSAFIIYSGPTDPTGLSRYINQGLVAKDMRPVADPSQNLDSYGHFINEHNHEFENMCRQERFGLAALQYKGYQNVYDSEACLMLALELQKDEKWEISDGLIAILARHHAKALINYSSVVTEPERKFLLAHALNWNSIAINYLEGSLAHKSWVLNNIALTHSELKNYDDAQRWLVCAHSLFFAGFHEELKLHTRITNEINKHRGLEAEEHLPDIPHKKLAVWYLSIVKTAKGIVCGKLKDKSPAKNKMNISVSDTYHQGDKIKQDRLYDYKESIKFFRVIQAKIASPNIAANEIVELEQMRMLTAKIILSHLSYLERTPVVKGDQYYYYFLETEKQLYTYWSGVA